MLTPTMSPAAGSDRRSAVPDAPVPLPEEEETSRPAKDTLQKSTVHGSKGTPR